jgi:autotransporter translocation and assembly factor TamB
LPLQVIGRVGGLTLLNGADVKPRERRDCELRYLQNILAGQQAAAAAVMAAAAATNQQAAGAAEATAEQQQHPRLAELQAKYGHVR